MNVNPYPDNTGLLSDPRITNEVLGEALREAAKEHSRKYQDLLLRAAVIAAEKEVK